MKEIFIQANSLPDAYHLALVKMHLLKLDRKNEDDAVECGMTIHIESPICEPRVSKLIVGGARDLARYELEMTDGILDFEVGHNWTYTYHKRFEDHIPFIINELTRDTQSRRAVISIRDNDIDENMDDCPCMQHMHFLIRDCKLDLKVLFRSNDLCRAFFFNSFALIRLQEIIAENLNLPVGTYTHTANSMHVYPVSYEFLDGCAKRISALNPNDILTYNYEDDFKEQMIEEIPSIIKLVNEQKRKYKIE